MVLNQDGGGQGTSPGLAAVLIGEEGGQSSNLTLLDAQSTQASVFSMLISFDLHDNGKK